MKKNPSLALSVLLFNVDNEKGVLGADRRINANLRQVLLALLPEGRVRVLHCPSDWTLDRRVTGSGPAASNDRGQDPPAAVRNTISGKGA